MEYLHQANAVVAGKPVPGQISAEGKHVVIIGGGDTGSDCLGTALRQGAASVTTLAIGKKPPVERPTHQPWPTDPILFEVSSSHEEGGEREYLASTVEFVGDEKVERLRLAVTEYLPDGRRVPTPGTEREIPADLVLVAMGFTGPETSALTAQLGVELTERGTVRRSDDFATTVPGVFVAGDAGRGQSLVVWAIAEGRAAAAAVDTYLSGSTELPAPVTASTVAMRP
jgi:glutamate synthase (NADPH/NADH) small chain